MLINYCLLLYFLKRGKSLVGLTARLLVVLMYGQITSDLIYLLSHGAELLKSKLNCLKEICLFLSIVTVDSVGVSEIHDVDFVLNIICLRFDIFCESFKLSKKAIKKSYVIPQFMTYNSLFGRCCFCRCRYRYRIDL